MTSGTRPRAEVQEVTSFGWYAAVSGTFLSNDALTSGGTAAGGFIRHAALQDPLLPGVAVPEPVRLQRPDH